ncbi:MAG: ABC transporter substrate-binding protein [Betaproteobacteria bacterium]|nr:ABC transporter substrate-binding protein [Betaproteobacteria bacterium]
MRLPALVCGCIVLASASAAPPVTVVDDRGRVVTLARPAQRIVSLAPSLAEAAFAAGAGARLVGVARFSDSPPAARGIPRIGDAVRVDFERIVALRPDLILAWRSGNSAADVERLEGLGYAAYVSEPRRLGDIPRQLRAIGVLAGTAAEAEKAAAAFEREIGALRGRFSGARRVRVFYEIWRKPLMTVNGAHLISDVIALCGGENVFADVSQLTPTVSLEAVIAARPEAVLGGGSAGGEKAFTAGWRASAVQPLRDLPVYYINPDRIQQATPRIVEGARAVCAALEKVRTSRRDAGKGN